VTEDGDEHDRVQNYCADLVAESQNEAFVRDLLSRPAGEWASVNDLASKSGLEVIDLTDFDGSLYATWLEAPQSRQGSVAIFFFMPDEVWTSVAIYYRS
jgi:hypothetical protein